MRGLGAPQARTAIVVVSIELTPYECHASSLEANKVAAWTSCLLCVSRWKLWYFVRFDKLLVASILTFVDFLSRSDTKEAFLFFSCVVATYVYDVSVLLLERPGAYVLLHGGMLSFERERQLEL